jgi:AP2-like factor (euAP2 lineage)
MLTDNVSVAIVDADALDLDLRMSQPNAPDSKRGNIMAGLQLTYPESSSAMVSQVRKIQH